jgi:hypothetical protein
MVASSFSNRATNQTALEGWARIPGNLPLNKEVVNGCVSCNRRKPELTRSSPRESKSQPREALARLAILLIEYVTQPALLNASFQRAGAALRDVPQFDVCTFRL